MLPTTKKSKEIVLQDDGFWLRQQTTVDTFLGKQEDHLRQLLYSRVIKVTPDLVFSGETCPVHMVSQNETTLLCQRLTSLPFSTTFVQHSSRKTWIPTFNSIPGGSDEVKLKAGTTFAWPSSWGILLFVSDFSYAMFSDDPWRLRGNYLFCVNNGEIVHTEYPNTYSASGNICMGNSFDRFQGRTIINLFMDSLLSFKSTEMNSDLTTPNTLKVYERNEDNTDWLYDHRPNQVISSRFGEMIGYLTANYAL